jgi:hypothetical protein
MKPKLRHEPCHRPGALASQPPGTPSTSDRKRTTRRPSVDCGTIEDWQAQIFPECGPNVTVSRRSIEYALVDLVQGMEARMKRVAFFTLATGLFCGQN